MSGRARIAVVRALHGLGDMLCAVPAMSALRQAHPEARIVLVGLPACRWMLERFDTLIDALWPFPGFPGIPERAFSRQALDSFVTDARNASLDLAIQMHGSGDVSNRFTQLLGARTTAGLYAGSPRPSGRFFPYPRRGSEVQRCLFLMRALDCPSADDRLRFPVRDEDRAALAEHDVLSQVLDEPLVCLHPGARDPARRWPAERFASVGDALAERGFRIVLTGTSAERGTAEHVAGAMTRPVLNAAGLTTLGLAAALLERAALLVTNDTGISHLAAALGTPSVIVFLASDPERWAPLDRERHRAVVARALVERVVPAQMRVSRQPMPSVHEILDEAMAVTTGPHDKQ